MFSARLNPHLARARFVLLQIEIKNCDLTGYAEALLVGISRFLTVSISPKMWPEDTGIRQLYRIYSNCLGTFPS